MPLGEFVGGLVLGGLGGAALRQQEIDRASANAWAWYTHARNLELQIQQLQSDSAASRREMLALREQNGRLQTENDVLKSLLRQQLSLSDNGRYILPVASV